MRTRSITFVHGDMRIDVRPWFAGPDTINPEPSAVLHTFSAVAPAYQKRTEWHKVFKQIRKAWSGRTYGEWCAQPRLLPVPE